ncbi:putative cytochrome c oxidase [Vibrio ishigakensis]|uniref:Putative cytochrome c oxidase n=1 Tax=Vibrio ishigakensis TaxID=1481914 RepID=A0A0B8PP36_9VIBR|nr:putative cytochrome c oxidase [Vibrio ishigakensis]GAM67388.1 cytochrome c oxidase [Vibrio sp. JCM 19236]
MPRTFNENDFQDSERISDSEYAKTIPCNQISISDPFQWLAMGLNDMVRSPIISFFYGFCFAAAAAGIVGLINLQGVHSHLVVLPALIVYMLIGPFLALGLYDVSWSREKGKQPNLVHSMKAIGRNSTSQWAFAVLLVVTMIFWMRIAALLHALYPSVAGASIIEFAPFLITGSIAGFILASLVFSISVFSIPLMLERRVDMMTAVFTSFNAVRKNPAPMAVWAVIICGGVLIGFATYGIGMIVTMPILGYGTWHAYHATIQKKHH